MLALLLVWNMLPFRMCVMFGDAQMKVVGASTHTPLEIGLRPKNLIQI
jgi:hypothetical protein